MRIRTQIVFAVVPLFLGMTLVTGALTYSLQVKELTWGLEEEATSIAVSAARLMDGEAVRRLAAGGAPQDSAVRDQFQAIVRWGRARRLSLLAGGDGRVLLDVTDGSPAGGGVSVPARVAAALEAEPFAVGPTRREPGGGTFLSAFAPVRDDAGALLGVVAVETRADSFAARRAAILQSALISLCAASLLGLLLAALIATMITRRLSRLTRAVLRVEEAGAAPAAGMGVIDEVNDLVNTFDTMKSVLGDVLASSNRALIEAEQFRTEEDLAQAYREEFQQSGPRSIAGMEVAGVLLGARPSGGFFGMWEVPGGGCAFVGTVSEQGALEQSVVAAAAVAYLEQASRAGAVAPALSALLELFPLIQGEGAAWGSGAGDAARWTLDWGAGSWREERVAMPAGATVILHTLGAPAARRLSTYAAQFRRLPPEEFLREVPGVLDENAAGAVLVLRRAGAVSDCGPTSSSPILEPSW